MNLTKTITLIAALAICICAQIPVGGFSNIKAFRENTPDIIDTSFRLSSIAKSTDKSDLDFRLEHRDERGRMKNYRDEIIAFADGNNYYVADGTHSLGSPRFRKLTRCEIFSYFRRVQTMPSGMGGHSADNLNEIWVILDHTDGHAYELTDRVVKQYLLRTQKLLYNEYTDRNKRNGNPIDYIRRVCSE